MNNFSLNETVNARYSTRTFEDRVVEAAVKEKILSYAKKLTNPFGPSIRVQFIEKETAANGEKLGTYGIINGAKLYMGVTIPNEEGALEALGYEFEELVLYMTSLGLGTCWIGGTFNKGAFAEAMDIKENEIFPIISPIGYPAKIRFAEKMFRGAIKADKRYPWEEMFFESEFGKPLSKEVAGEYQFPLEMVRLAPSAVNKQPWRIVYDGTAYHFFEKHSLGGEEVGTFDMQRIDLGIALNHFYLATQEKNLPGKFEKMAEFDFMVPAGVSYVASWVVKPEFECERT